MNTSAKAIEQLQQAQATTKEAIETINNLIAAHDYQDVAAMIAQAAAGLLESATLLMHSKDEEALAALELADDFLDSVYDIIEAELDDE